MYERIIGDIYEETEKYLYEKSLRKVAIIVSRKGADTNAKKAARGSLRESGKGVFWKLIHQIRYSQDMKKLFEV